MAYWNVGDKIGVAEVASPAQHDINRYGGAWQMFRGLHLRTHPDADKAGSQVMLVGLDEVVMNDGCRYTGLPLPLTADITVSGAGGLDTGVVALNTWYKILLIGKSSTKLASDLRLIFHRAKDYKLDQFFTSSFDTNAFLRKSTGTATDLLAEGVQFATGGPVERIDITMARTGAVTGRVWLELRSDNAGSPSTTVLATSDKIDASALPTTMSYIALLFRTPFTVVPSTQYHIVLNGDYTRSDTVNIAWGGVIAGGYANGTAKQYNGTTWGAATGVGDFQFRAYVTENNAADNASLPSGYDETCQLGWVCNVNAFRIFVARDRSVSSQGPDALATLIANTNPVIYDCSTYLPPCRVTARAFISNGIGDAGCLIGGFPDGYVFQLQTLYPGLTSRIITHSSGLGFPPIPIPTEYQGLYAFVEGGSLNLWLGGYEW